MRVEIPSLKYTLYIFSGTVLEVRIKELEATLKQVRREKGIVVEVNIITWIDTGTYRNWEVVDPVDSKNVSTKMLLEAYKQHGLYT